MTDDASVMKAATNGCPNVVTSHGSRSLADAWLTDRLNRAAMDEPLVTCWGVFRGLDGFTDVVYDVDTLTSLTVGVRGNRNKKLRRVSAAEAWIERRRAEAELLDLRFREREASDEAERGFDD